MTGKETTRALKDIAQAKYDSYTAQMGALDSTHKTERKALAISQQVAANCRAFADIDFKNRVYTKEVRVFGSSFHDFDEWKDTYNALEGDDRDSFIEFSFAVIMARHAFYHKHKTELENPQLSAEKRFEYELIISVIDDILRDWQRWWNEHGCVKCEVIPLE